MSPHAVPRHELIAKRLMTAIDPHVPQGFEALGSVGIVLDRSYRVTESPSSITTDRVTKPAQYAAAGVAHFWRVEIDPLRLHTYRLAGEVYELTGSWGEDEIARVTDPFLVDLDLSTLLPR